MDEVGHYLKQIRISCCLSLKEVHDHCGITDSKLSRMERGEGKPLSPSELRKLAKLYEVSVIPLYIMAGYLTESDLVDYQLGFRNASLLNDEEKQSIQTQIYLLTKGRQVSGNGI